jgi:hypothetical protein
MAFIRRNSIINVFGYFTGTLKLLYVRNRIRIDVTTGRQTRRLLPGGTVPFETLLMNRLVGMIWFFHFFFFEQAEERSAAEEKLTARFLWIVLYWFFLKILTYQIRVNKSGWEGSNYASNSVIKSMDLSQLRKVFMYDHYCLSKRQGMVLYLVHIKCLETVKYK